MPHDTHVQKPYITELTGQYGDSDVVPKTERFEMRLDPNMIERVDSWRSAQDDVPSRSEAIRRLIEAGLASRATDRLLFKNKDKLQVWLLSEILKLQISSRKMSSGDAHTLKSVELIQECIFGGHFWALEWEMQGIFNDYADDPGAVHEVVQILDTWDFIERAYERFSVVEKDYIAATVGPLGDNPCFAGFDGNNESEVLGIARFLINKLGRFQHFSGRELNSHMPTLNRYRRMANAFDPTRSLMIGRGLNPDEVCKLLSA